jgi:hypothetical protein
MASLTTTCLPTSCRRLPQECSTRPDRSRRIRLTTPLAGHGLARQTVSPQLIKHRSCHQPVRQHFPRSISYLATAIGPHDGHIGVQQNEAGRSVATIEEKYFVATPMSWVRYAGVARKGAALHPVACKPRFRAPGDLPAVRWSRQRSARKSPRTADLRTPPYWATAFSFC